MSMQTVKSLKSRRISAGNNYRHSFQAVGNPEVIFQGFRITYNKKIGNTLPMNKSRKLKEIQCHSDPYLSYYGSIIHSILLSNNVKKRNVYLKFDKINIRFFILWNDTFRKNFCRGPPFFFVVYEQREKRRYV